MNINVCIVACVACVTCVTCAFYARVVMPIVRLREVVHHSSWPVRKAIRRCLSCYWSTVQILRCVCMCVRVCVRACVCVKKCNHLCMLHT